MSFKINNIQVESAFRQTQNELNNRINGLDVCNYILTASSPDDGIYYLSYKNGSKVLSSNLQFNNLIVNNINVILSQNGTATIETVNIDLKDLNTYNYYPISSLIFNNNQLFLQQQLFNNNINILYSGFTGYYTFKFKDNNDNIIKLLPVTIKEITIDVLC